MFIRLATVDEILAILWSLHLDFVPVHASEQTLFNFLILGKSLFPPNKVL